MNDVHRDLYIQWCRSPRVELLTRTPSGEIANAYPVPHELLTRRSRYFRDRSHHPTESEQYDLNGVTDKTAKHFFIWLHSPQPKVDEDAAFEDVTDLGIFAWRFGVPALSNQITDRIRAHLASDEWQLKAGVVDGIYQAGPSGSPLREVVRAALGKLPKSAMESGADRDEWKATILRHAELGWDYIEASGSQWTAEGYLSGVCRFHDHEDVLGQKNEDALCDGCPFAGEDCYPVSLRTGSKAVVAEGLGEMNGTSARNGAVQAVNGKAEDKFVDDEAWSISTRQKVGNGIMITDDDFFAHQPKDAEPASGAVSTANGKHQHMPTHSNGAVDIIEEAVEESNETVTSADQADESMAPPIMHAMGTMTDTLSGDIVSGEKADDEASKGLNKLKSKKKKKRGTSFSVGSG